MSSSVREKAPLTRVVYTGTFISTPSLGSLKILEDAAIGVDEAGIIRHVEPKLEVDSESNDEKYETAVSEVVEGWGWDGGSVEWVRGPGDGEVTGGGKGWFFPGFVGEFIEFSLEFEFSVDVPSKDRMMIGYVAVMR